MPNTLNLASFFRDFTDSTKKIRMVIGYDSMADEMGSGERCSVERALSETWEVAQTWTSRSGPAAFNVANRIISNTAINTLNTSHTTRPGWLWVRRAKKLLQASDPA